MRITQPMKKELEWWIKNVHNQNRVIDRQNPQITVQTDASLIGLGALLKLNDNTLPKTGTQWTDVEKLNTKII